MDDPAKELVLKGLPKKVQQRLSDLKELAFAIDSFEDIFSDFDPRDYPKRDLSDDFLNEVKKRYKETKSGPFEVIFYAPRTVQNEEVEKVVIHRIKQYYRWRVLQLKREVIVLRIRGGLYIICGILFLSSLTILNYKKMFSGFTFDLLAVIFSPLGWFGIWEGFSKLIDAPRRLPEELEFSRKMAKADYQFRFL